MKLIAIFAVLAASKWAYFGPDHKLQYKTDEHGNRIMDFSYAGYGGGGVKLPEAKVAKTVKTSPGDNTAAIQAAIDAVSAMPSGSRGAVLLAPGTFEVEGTITIPAGGVVLRGSGAGDGGTTVKLTGKPHRFLTVKGSGAWEADGNSTAITDPYVPSGASTFHVRRRALPHG